MPAPPMILPGVTGSKLFSTKDDQVKWPKSPADFPIIAQNSGDAVLFMV